MWELTSPTHSINTLCEISMFQAVASRVCVLGVRESDTQWSTNVSLDRIPGCYVTKYAPHKALKLISRGKLTFEERVVLHRVVESRPKPPVVFSQNVSIR